MKYTSTKEYTQLGPVAYRQWRADSHCNQIHGYAMSFYFEFESDTIDARNWVIDFGSLKPLKEFLNDKFDHCLLLASDDPNYDDIKKLGDLGIAKITEVDATGCEAIAKFLYEYINGIFLTDFGEQDRVWCTKVAVRETDANMAMVTGTREDKDSLFDDY